LTKACLPPVADLDLPDAAVADDFDGLALELLFDWPLLDGLPLDEPFLEATFLAEPALLSPALVNPALATGLVVFDLTFEALLEFFADLPFSTNLDLLGLAATGFEAEFFLATGFDEGPLAAGFFAGFFTGFGVGLLLPAFLEAGFRAVFFFDALATAFTNRC